MNKEDKVEVNRRAVEIISGHSDNILIENSSKGPFRHIDNLNRLLNEKSSGITMDVGHLILNRGKIEDFLEKGRESVKHFHIHATSKGRDHFLFNDREQLLDMMSRISKFKESFPFALEIFLKNGEGFTSIEERRKSIFSHLGEIKGTDC